jgi:regulator of protease activity HflC (stomatin/prohibitin superfamily)
MNYKVLALVPVFALSACGFEVVDTGHRGIETRFGKIVGEPLDEGLHFYNPFTSSVKEIDVREQKLETETVSFTKDTQSVTLKVAVTYYPNKSKIHELYQQFGTDYAEKIINQIVLGSIKDSVGQYIADELVQSRERVKSAAQLEMTESLASRNIIVTRLDFINLDFDDAYERAVEAKVVAVQKAAEAKNKTVEVEERAKQTVVAAEAEARAMRIKSEALAQNKGLVQFEAVQRWNGVLPVNMYGSAPLPFLNLQSK